MSETSTFISRKGIAGYSPEKIFNFAADIRNFKRFIPANAISGLVAEKDSCRFSVSMLGNVEVRIKEKTEFSLIVYSGTFLQTNTFDIYLYLEQDSDQNTELFMEVKAEMNPMLKMIASEPLKRFLENLITEIENFKGWDDVVS